MRKTRAVALTENDIHHQYPRNWYKIVNHQIPMDARFQLHLLVHYLLTYEIRDIPKIYLVSLALQRIVKTKTMLGSPCFSCKIKGGCRYFFPFLFRPMSTHIYMKKEKK